MVKNLRMTVVMAALAMMLVASLFAVGVQSQGNVLEWGGGSAEVVAIVLDPDQPPTPCEYVDGQWECPPDTGGGSCGDLVCTVIDPIVVEP